MKIAIIADTHDNLANIKKVIDWLNKEKVNLILHCGDIATLETIRDGFKDFKGEMLVSLGNADVKHNIGPGKYNNCNIFSEFGEVSLGEKKIAFTHFLATAEKLAEEGKYQIIFYGHNHKPWEHKVGNCRLINPGEVAGQFFKSTFAIYDSDKDKLELKMVEKLEF